MNMLLGNNNAAARLKTINNESIFLSQEKNLHTRRTKLSFSRNNTEYCVKAAFCCFELSWKIKNITKVDFNNKVLND